MMDWTPPPPLACSLTPIHAPTPRGRLIHRDADERGMEQPFRLQLRSQAAGDATLLHCSSDVGPLEIEHDDDRLRVLTRFVLKYTLRAAHLELGGVDLDLAVEDDVLPLDRADMTQQVGVEREVRRGGKP